jgi:hypothetical protein
VKTISYPPAEERDNTGNEQIYEEEYADEVVIYRGTETHWKI